MTKQLHIEHTVFTNATKDGETEKSWEKLVKYLDEGYKIVVQTPIEHNSTTEIIHFILLEPERYEGL